MAGALTTVEARTLSPEELARIAYLRDDTLQYGYAFIVTSRTYYDKRVRNTFGFMHMRDGVEYYTPRFPTPEEAVLEYHDHPERYPRVKYHNIPLPTIYPPHIILSEMLHMVTNKSRFGFKGVNKANGDQYFGRYQRNGVLYYVGGAKYTPIEAAWEVREFFPKKPKPPKVYTFPEQLPPMDLSALKPYASGKSKYGYSNVRYSTYNDAYRCVWLVGGVEQCTACWSSPEEAVWEYHCKTKDTLVDSTSREAAAKQLARNIAREYAAIAGELPWQKVK